MLSDEQLLKYSRQIMLPKIDIEGQEKLVNSTVLILGLGGLGAPVSMYLAAAGVGSLILIDDDVVELSNLQRQISHSTHDIGKLKVESAAETAKALNPDLLITSISERLNASQIDELVRKADVVVDCCDNFETRFLLNQICFKNKTGLVSGAAIRWEGQLATFSMMEDKPCYRCLYDEDAFNDQTCAQNGVVSPLVGVIGAMQALETIKLITGAGDCIESRLLIFDALYSEWRSIKLIQKDNCPVCSKS